MRRIERTRQFRRDYKRVSKGRRQATVDAALASVLKQLTEGSPLAVRYRDHALTGDWRDHRDCHLFPDLVLVYSEPDAATLRLVRLGSHSELGM